MTDETDYFRIADKPDTIRLITSYIDVHASGTAQASHRLL
jgi:hypothetical protein